MKNLLKALAALIIPFSLFFGLAWFMGTYVRENPDALPPYLSFLHPDAEYVDEAVKFIGTLMIAPAVWGFFHYLSGVGNRRPDFDGINGVTTLKILPGVRIFMFVAALGLGGGFAFGASQADRAVEVGLFGLFSALFAYSAIWVLAIRVQYDRDGLVNMNWRFARKRYAWSELTRLLHNSGTQEYHFHFADGRKAKVSTYFAGIDELVAMGRQEYIRRRQHA